MGNKLDVVRNAVGAAGAGSLNVVVVICPTGALNVVICTNVGLEAVVEVVVVAMEVGLLVVVVFVAVQTRAMHKQP